MASGNGSLDGLNGSDRNVDWNVVRDYDGLKQQFDKASHELQILRRQNSETTRRYEHSQKEMEYYRNQHHAAISQLEVAAQESSALRSKYSELVSDKQRLDREVVELRSSCCSQKEMMVADSEAEAFSNRYITMRNKYEVLKEDYESLQHQYDDVFTSHTTAVDQLDLAKEEINRLKDQNDELKKEMINALRENKVLKHQCTQAVQHRNLIIDERNELQDALKKSQQQQDEAMKEINAAMTIRMKTNKDIKKLTDERNAARQELALTLSERGSMHEEMKKISEDLTQAYKKIKVLENENKGLTEEKKTLCYQIETLKREITSALHDRDKALKECNDIQQRFGYFTANEESQRESLKSRYDISRERDLTRENLCQLRAASIDLFNKCQKERMDNLDQANQEIENLRTCLDKQQADLQEALQEAEVSKRRRDWAFNERDKIVLERESIRTLCDRLRKERDRAVSELAEALRDTDDIKKQKNETTKELKVLKEKMEAQLEKENRTSAHLENENHNYSHDSAIDADLHEWEMLTLNIDLNGLGSNENLGIELVGGRDDPYYTNDCGIYVVSVSKSSFLYGKLQVNDCILRVNNVDCSNVSSRMVMETIRSSVNSCVVNIRRRRVGPRSLFTTQLKLNKYDHGLSLDMGIYISKIVTGSLAAKEGNLAIGDRVISINNRLMDGVKSAHEAMIILNQPTDVLSITTLKCSSSSYCANNSCASSTRDVYKKYANSSTQTDHRLFVSKYENRSVYSPTSKSDTTRPLSSIGKFNISRAKDMLKGKRFLRLDKKQSHLTYEQDIAMAVGELDSVIESEDQRNKERELEKNGGTWPRTRMGPLLEQGTATILHAKKRERVPLTALPTKASEYRQSCYAAYSDVSQGSKECESDFSVKSSSKMSGQGVAGYYAKQSTTVYSGNESNESHSNLNLYGGQRYQPSIFVPISHRQSLSAYLGSRYSSPPRVPSSQSGESISLADSRTYCFEPPYSPPQQFHRSHSPSIDLSYHKCGAATKTYSRKGGTNNYRIEELPVESYHSYQSGTFPRKKENQRFRIPSNPSVTSKSSAGKLSTGSIEKSSERSSPMPTFHVEVLSAGCRPNKRSSLPPDYCWSRKPLPGELRRVHIDKSVEPLGIQIQCLDGGGVFVSTVTKHSIASQVGLQVGDQLLEVCGINMRSATYPLAANVLSQCGNSITMLVQYNPEKYNGPSGSESSASSGAEESISETQSGSPTPCNSPGLSRKLALSVTSSHLPYTVGTLKSSDREKEKMHHPRYIALETRKCSNLGISLVGGNAVGIFIHCVQANSLAYEAGLRTGDHILEYNGADLRQATAEEAAFELAKPADKVTALVQNDMERYNEIKEKPGDGFYIRTMFDRTGDIGDSLQLHFHKEDVLFVDNTMYNGVPGQWRAWLIDNQGYRQQWGVIPSKYKVEEEFLLKRSLGDLGEVDVRRTTRRSFFRRKKHHQRCDSKELASFSNFSLGWFSDSGSLNEETSAFASYQKVTRLDSEPMLRPVMIVGPLSECVVEKLLADFPDRFVRCVPEVSHCSENGGNFGDPSIIDYRKKGNFYERYSVSTVKEACNKRCHCIVDVSLASVERLHHNRIYPIVLLIKFKSTKQIKEVKDTRYPMDKIAAKSAKEMYERALKLESEYRHYISAIIPAGVNVAYMCTQIKAAVESEQSKTLWVPSSPS